VDPTETRDVAHGYWNSTDDILYASYYSGSSKMYYLLDCYGSDGVPYNMNLALSDYSSTSTKQFRAFNTSGFGTVNSPLYAQFVPA
jgi:hypothetical protein